MSDVLRHRVHIALLCDLETQDVTLEPIREVRGIIGSLAVQQGYRVQIVGEPSSARVYLPGDHLAWPREQADGSRREEYGLVVDNAGAVMIQFADGQSVPLPSQYVV